MTLGNAAALNRAPPARVITVEPFFQILYSSRLVPMHAACHFVATLFRGGVFLGMGYCCLLLFENVLESEFDFSSLAFPV